MKVAKPSKLSSVEEKEETKPDSEKSEFEHCFGYECSPKEAMDIMLKSHMLKKDKKLMAEVGKLAESHKKPIKSLAQLRKVRDGEDA